MSILASLHASETAFRAIGLEPSAETCRRLARQCAVLSDLFGPDMARALYEHKATELAVRAVDKTQQYNMRSAAA
jgi:hypothetical protein